MTGVNRNGDKPTISADSLNTIIFCHSVLNVSLQKHHTNHMTACSDRHSPFSALRLWPQRGHGTFWEAPEGHHAGVFADRSQLLTLQHGLRRGAGEEDGAGLRCGES